MASLYVPSRLGSPLIPGGKLFFYQTGTTSPQNTYSQSDLAIGHVNTNPVVADSNGLFGPIYLLASPDYKAVLTQPDGVTAVWTTDPLLTSAVSVITTEGDLIVGNVSGNATRLPIGANKKYLKSNGTDPAWSDLLLADATDSLARTGMPVGSVVQCVTISTNAYSSHSTAIPLDDTIPQSTEGDLILTASITPTTTSNRVRVTAELMADGGAATIMCALFRGAGVNAIASSMGYSAAADTPVPMILLFEDVPGSVSAQTYNLRVGPNTSTMYINGVSGGRLLGGTMLSSMRLEEIVT